MMALLVVALTAFIILMCKAFYNKYFPKKSLYSTIPANSNNFQADLTVIHIANDSLYVTHQQLVCISKLLAETFPEDFVYQILCLHLSVPPAIKKQMKTLFPNNPKIQFVELNTNSNYELNYFLVGCAKANGNIIVDSRYLPDIIGKVNNYGTEFIEFHKRNAETILFPLNQDHYMVPVALSKRAADKLLMRLPSFPYGFGFTLYNLARHMNVPINMIEAKYNPTVENFAEILLTELYLMYLQKLEQYFVEKPHHYLLAP